MATTLSSIFEIKFKLETGLSFLKTSMSKDAFLRIGVTWACLKKLGHFPCLREALIIEVMGVMRIWR